MSSLTLRRLTTWRKIPEVDTFGITKYWARELSRLSLRHLTKLMELKLHGVE
nr:hypothetical protein Iba_chr12bCG0040 [Ipomoea batatas]GME13845.1 hypothetical protein Iba_scaffold14771CG0040 [Ipomoea batatas]GME17252.1 hypothetical protein Iba_scaffold18403CG1160 [Ipomoea batatas]